MTTEPRANPGGGASDDPIDRLVDMALYAPVGLLLAARDALPQWVEKGRQQLSAQIPLARTIGELAVKQGTRQARQRLERLRRQTDDLLSEKPTTDAPITEGTGPEHPDPPPPAATAPVFDLDDDDADWDGDDDEVLPDDVRAGLLDPGTPPPDVGELPIPGYDTLSASQVVQRLPGLSIEELEAVRTYELAGRARKTVLLRVAQLRAAS